MLDTLHRCIASNSVVTLDKNFRCDLDWWSSNLQHWNRVSFLDFAQHHNKVALDASTDGALDGGPGIGGFNFITNEWFKSTVPIHMQDWHISDLELIAHIIAIRLWGHHWRGFQIWGLTDSKPAQFLLHYGRSRVNRCLQMARTIASLEHQLGFMWVSGPIRSKENILPDCASRWHDPERRTTFWKTCEDLHIVPIERSVSPLMFVY
jgi:hypothetical protein